MPSYSPQLRKNVARAAPIKARYSNPPYPSIPMKIMCWNFFCLSGWSNNFGSFDTAAGQWFAVGRRREDVSNDIKKERQNRSRSPLYSIVLRKRQRNFAYYHRYSFFYKEKDSPKNSTPRTFILEVRFESPDFPAPRNLTVNTEMMAMVHNSFPEI